MKDSESPALEAARSAFADHAAPIYAGGAAAADRDSDDLEALSDRLVDLIETLEPIFDRLELARDIALYRGPVLKRQRAPYRVRHLAELTASAFAEELLSAPAGAVLMAAVRHRLARAP